MPYPYLLYERVQHAVVHEAVVVEGVGPQHGGAAGHGAHVVVAADVDTGLDAVVANYRERTQKKGINGSI